MDDKIYKLKSLISEYETLVNEMETMKDLWESYGDPGSDPGLQFEKDNEIQKQYNKIKNFVKSEM